MVHTVNLKESWGLIQGLPVRYRESIRRNPPDTPTIIHLHGFAISGTYLLPTADELAEDYQTYVPDLPGFGRSHEPTPELGISDLADSTAEFMDMVGVERATLVGNSMGCITSIEFARKYPERVERIVLCSPAGGPNNQPLIKGILQLIRDGFHEPIRLGPIAVADYLRFGLFDVFKLYRSMVSYPTLEQFSRIEVPTLVIKGSDDPLVSEERVIRYSSPNPMITAIKIEDAAHAMNFSHPQELASVIRQFLTDQPITDDPIAKGETVVYDLDRPAQTRSS